MGHYDRRASPVLGNSGCQYVLAPNLTRKDKALERPRGVFPGVFPVGGLPPGLPPNTPQARAGGRVLGEAPAAVSCPWATWAAGVCVGKWDAHSRSAHLAEME